MDLQFEDGFKILLLVQTGLFLIKIASIVTPWTPPVIPKYDDDKDNEKGKDKNNNEDEEANEKGGRRRTRETRITHRYTQTQAQTQAWLHNSQIPTTQPSWSSPTSHEANQQAVGIAL